MSPSKPRAKVIEGLAPETPVVDAAHRVLDARLRNVEDLLDEATSGREMDAKTVHRLRVSTRRAGAALRAFKKPVSDKARRRAARALRRVRREAGQARMCDAQRDRFRDLLAEVEPALAAPIGVVIGRLTELRVQEGRAIRALRDDDECGLDALRRRRKKLLGSIDARTTSRSFRDLAFDHVPLLARRMAEAGSSDLTLIDNVHALRIFGKSVRYALEIFQCCFDPDAHHAMLVRISEFQDRVGALNDLWEMSRRVKQYEADSPPGAGIGEGLAALDIELSRRVESAHRAFLDWWSGRGIEAVFGAPSPARAGAWNGLQESVERNGTLGRQTDRLIQDAMRQAG